MSAPFETLDGPARPPFRRLTRCPRSPRRGFLLLEVLPELSIVAIVVVGLAALLASVLGDRPLRTGDAAAAEAENPLPEIPDSVYAMSVLSDGGIVVSTYRCPLARLDRAGGICWRVPEFHSEWWPSALSAGRAVTGDHSGAVKLREGFDENTQVVTLGWHRDPVARVAISANGAIAASLSLSGETRVWDLDARAEISALCTGGSRPSDILTLSPDGSLLVRASEDRVRLDAIPSGERVAELAQPRAFSTPHAVRISPDNRLLVEGDCMGQVVVWDLASQAVVWREEGFTSALSVEFAADLRSVMAGFMSGEVAIYDAADGKLRGSFTPHARGVRVIHALADGEFLTAGYDGRIRRWDPRTLCETATPR